MGVTARLGWCCGRELWGIFAPTPAQPLSRAPVTQSCKVWGRAWALGHHLQLRDVLGDPLGQGLEVLVAAADNGVEACALLRALRTGDAARLLLTCTGHRQPQSPWAPHEAGLNALCSPRTAPLPCQPYPLTPKQGAVGNSLSPAGSQQCRNLSCAQKPPAPLGWMQSDSSRLL